MKIIIDYVARTATAGLFRAKTKKPPTAKNRFMFHQMEMAAMMKRGH
jgi:hypothetical protein